jgi:mannose-6-phosphate isomerase-like protein (cupin superfamily)
MQTDFRAVIRRPCETRRHRINPQEEVLIKISTEEANGEYCVLEHHGGLEAAPPIHLHRTADELFEVLEGRVGFWLDGQIVEARPGTTIRVPRNMPHGWRNLGDTESRMIITFIPGGTDGFFEAAEGIPHSDPRAAKIAEQYGTVYIAAPLEAKLWDAAPVAPQAPSAPLTVTATSGSEGRASRRLSDPEFRFPKVG